MNENDARQRIMDAALSEFGNRGFAGASIRRIARAAKVSPALIQYHFGTKDALREACDAWALDWLERYKVEGLEHGRYADPEYLSQAMNSVEPILDYLVTAFASNADIASDWYDKVQRMMLGILRSGAIGPPLTEEDDVQAVSAVVAAMSLGITLFYREIDRVLRDDEHPEDTIARVGRARMLLAPNRIVGQEILEQSRRGIDAYVKASTPADSDEASTGDDTTDSPLQQQRKARTR